MISADATAVELRRMLQTCPACAANLDNHSYSRFAITVASPENNERLSGFSHALKGHDWAALKLFDDFNPLLNALEVIVLRCDSGVLVVLAVHNPFELYESAGVLDYDVLDPVATDALSSLIAPDKWRPLSLTVAA